jgi:hypothetical protein
VHADLTDAVRQAMWSAGDRVAARAAVRLPGAVVLVTAINLVAGLGSVSSDRDSVHAGRPRRV